MLLILYQIDKYYVVNYICLYTEKIVSLAKYC